MSQARSLFIHPDGVNIGELAKRLIVHPRTQKKVLCLYDKKSGSLYELNLQKEQNRSMLFHCELSNLNVYFLTKIDPVFFLLPFLIQNSDKFTTLDSIFDEDFYGKNKDLIESCESRLESVCDLKQVSSMNLYKLNKTKALDWLSEKVLKLAKMCPSDSMQEYLNDECAICASLSAQEVLVQDSDKNYISEDNLKLVAFEVVSDHLSVDLSEELRVCLNLPQPVQKKQTPLVSAKAKNDKPSAPTEDYSEVFKNKELAATNKKTKSIPKGVQSIKNFFTPK
ncbi:hypothetical protein Ciccas_006427 [Cichlidogyrus casuarinus]|uniref:Ribonuclease H2 subunit B wHTH domain-containing protein n=1 Tax=Cichlidogyrus casuarinus TaxID=1844966 RepID=A0ABD2Q670_9PLAT